MDFKIGTWNIRSMNKLNKQKEVRKLIIEERIQVCAILETHIKPHKLPKACDRAFGDWNWLSNVSHSQNGCRILVTWDRNMVDLVIKKGKNYGGILVELKEWLVVFHGCLLVTSMLLLTLKSMEHSACRSFLMICKTSLIV
ncbi:hypothetical protein CTI12_AA490900 [Artemisia annua]|uniref:RNA-directed DNA polymerase, eukaryota, Reverse transcriptase zinc-binding domain protein n=1 Tax=Artemisia annua TaxID=35608 RepID=A0A2U1LHN7_ARTAN|nr:hypothetical protein CTI12_AA490900 [Artemisia annua]